MKIIKLYNEWSFVATTHKKLLEENTALQGQHDVVPLWRNDNKTLYISMHLILVITFRITLIF